MSERRKGRAVRDPAYLADIDIACRLIEEFTRRKNFADFVATPMLNMAVTKALENIGEATKHLSAEVKARHPDIPWRQIARFRDLAAHHYWEIDHGVVWDIVENHLQRLHQAIKAELAALPRPPGRRSPSPWR